MPQVKNTPVVKNTIVFYTPNEVAQILVDHARHLTGITNGTYSVAIQKVDGNLHAAQVHIKVELDAKDNSDRQPELRNRSSGPDRKD